MKKSLRVIINKIRVLENCDDVGRTMRFQKTRISNTMLYAMWYTNLPLGKLEGEAMTEWEIEEFKKEVEKRSELVRNMIDQSMKAYAQAEDTLRELSPDPASRTMAKRRSADTGQVGDVLEERSRRPSRARTMTKRRRRRAVRRRTGSRRRRRRYVKPAVRFVK